MAQEYGQVLTALEQPFRVIGRGERSSRAFEQKLGVPVVRGGVAAILDHQKAPKTAVVAVGVDQLFQVASMLISAGTRRMLLEKPGGLNLAEVSQLAQLAEKNDCAVFVAYNRRFYDSVRKASEILCEDGGLLSMHFEFTEWGHVIGPLKKPNEVKEKWLLANSSHVIDLAFYFGGIPNDWTSWRHGALDWHRAGAIFSGAGKTDRGVIFSYASNWLAPGRWGIELMTPRRRLLLKPLEQLYSMDQGQLDFSRAPIAHEMDEKFKPGLYKQTRAFLQSEDDFLCTLEQQVNLINVYYEIAGYA
jgi:predicted dehydrogenase